LCDRSVDLVLCVEAAFHFETRAAFLCEAHRVLVPGGWLLLSDVTGTRGAGRVPPANRLPDPAAYRALLARLRFVHLRAADVTSRTWSAFRRSYARFACRRAPLALRILPRLPWLLWRALVSDRAIGAYVTVAARRDRD